MFIGATTIMWLVYKATKGFFGLMGDLLEGGLQGRFFDPFQRTVRR